MSRMLALRVPVDLEKRLRSAAKKLKREKSDLVRLAIERFLSTEARADGLTLYERAKGVIGSVKTGLPDLGSNHREHLRTRFSRGQRTVA